MINKENYDSRLSVVIATLGGDCLKGTIDKLNSGTILPDEILICIPKEFVENVTNLNYKNLEIIETECKGQVAQRAIGFQSAKYGFVLQLDDDIILDRDCLRNMIESLESSPSELAVATHFMNTTTGQSYYQRPESSVFFYFYYWLINSDTGYKPGSITKAASCVGYDFSQSRKLHFSEWLPGGCILHRKKNLITLNFYPFSGKAFAEDLFHSELLKEKGIDLAFVRDAIAWIKPLEKGGFLINLQNYYSDFKARRKFFQLYPEGKSLWRLYAYYVLNFFRYVF